MGIIISQLWYSHSAGLAKRPPNFLGSRHDLVGKISRLNFLSQGVHWLSAKTNVDHANDGFRIDIFLFQGIIFRCQVRFRGLYSIINSLP